MTDKNKSKAEYYKPFIVDKTASIPHGVFVISNDAKKKVKELNKVKLVGIWKSIRDVKLNGGPKITGWRTDVAKDLEHVNKVMNKVEYYFHFRGKEDAILSIGIIVSVMIISTIVCYILKKH